MNKKKFILLALLLLCAYFYELFGGKMCIRDRIIAML